MMTVTPEPLISQRLILRPLNENDSDFIYQQCNDPAFIQHIGDKQIRNHQDALDYLKSGPIASYQREGYGLMCMQLISSGERIGMCGLLKRDELEGPDIGYSLLPSFRRLGYVNEACRTVLEDAFNRLELPGILAIVSSQNQASIKVLQNLGFQFIEQRKLSMGPSYVYQIIRD